MKKNNVKKELFYYCDNFFINENLENSGAPHPNSVTCFLDISENLQWEDAAFSVNEEPSEVAVWYREWYKENF